MLEVADVFKAYQYIKGIVIKRLHN